jgi:hypothetical protein
MDPSQQHIGILMGGGKSFAVDLPAFQNLDYENPLRLILSGNQNERQFDLDSESLLQARGWRVDAECMAEVIRCALEPSVYALPERFADKTEFRSLLAKHFEYFGLMAESIRAPSEMRYVLIQQVTAPEFWVDAYFVPEKRLPELLSDKQLEDWQLDATIMIPVPGDIYGDEEKALTDFLDGVQWVHEYHGEYELPDMSILPKGSVVSRIVTSVYSF